MITENNRSKFDQYRMIFKYNSGRGAILCPKCSVIIKIGNEFIKEEMSAAAGITRMMSYFCDKCESKKRLLIEKINLKIFDYELD